MIFCDTSALAKYYVAEIESAALRSRLQSEDMVLASDLARVELMSTFHRQLRDQKWTRQEFQEVAGQFHQDNTVNYWTWLPLHSVIIDAASQLYFSLPETVFLRASDCLHLITALHHGFAEVCTFDRHQQRAVQALGLSLVEGP